jgi:voltage-gated potassium channel
MTAARPSPPSTGLAVAPARSRFRRRHVALWATSVLAAIVIGTMGYVVLLGWSPMDAWYMTMITLTTVGFREVGPLGTIGQVWTSVIAVAGVAIIFGTVGLAAEYIVEEVTSGRREARRMQESIDALSGHFVLCGYGRVGATVAHELVEAGRSVVVVDLIQESLDRAAADGHLVVHGDATTDAILRQAGVERARGLVTAIDTDALNVYVILSARQLNPGLTIIGRANTLEAEEKLLRAGADRIVSPYTRAGHRMAELAVRPGVVDYLDAALDHHEPAFGLESVPVVAAHGLDGRTVGEVRADGIVVLAVAHAEGAHARYESNPSDDRRLAAGESVIASGDAASLARLRARAG